MGSLDDVQVGGLLAVASPFELRESQVVEHGTHRFCLRGVDSLNQGDDPAECVESVVELDLPVVGPLVALVPKREHQIAGAAGKLTVERAAPAVGHHPQQEQRVIGRVLDDRRLRAVGERLRPVPVPSSCPRHVQRHERLQALRQQVERIPHPSPVAHFCHGVLSFGTEPSLSGAPICRSYAPLHRRDDERRLYRLDQPLRRIRQHVRLARLAPSANCLLGSRSSRSTGVDKAAFVLHNGSASQCCSARKPQAPEGQSEDPRGSPRTGAGAYACPKPSSYVADVVDDQRFLQAAEVY